jgi:hypothetical protein
MALRPIRLLVRIGRTPPAGATRRPLSLDQMQHGSVLFALFPIPYLRVLTLRRPTLEPFFHRVKLVELNPH